MAAEPRDTRGGVCCPQGLSALAVPSAGERGDSKPEAEAPGHVARQKCSTTARVPRGAGGLGLGGSHTLQTPTRAPCGPPGCPKSHREHRVGGSGATLEGWPHGPRPEPRTLLTAMGGGRLARQRVKTPGPAAPGSPRGQATSASQHRRRGLPPRGALGTSSVVDTGRPLSSGDMPAPPLPSGGPGGVSRSVRTHGPAGGSRRPQRHGTCPGSAAGWQARLVSTEQAPRLCSCSWASGHLGLWPWSSDRVTTSA